MHYTLYSIHSNILKVSNISYTSKPKLGFPSEKLILGATLSSTPRLEDGLTLTEGPDVGFMGR